MASILMIKQLIFNSFFRVTFGSKVNHVSRLSFTSASKFNQNSYPREDAGGEEDTKAAERIREARKVYGDYKDGEDDEIIEERYQDMKQNAKDTAHTFNEKVKEGAHKAGDRMHDAKEKTKNAMHDVKEKAKETAKGAWETAKDTSHKIKETVVGEDEDKYKTKPEDYMEDHLPKRPFDAKDQNVHRRGP